MRVRVQSFPPLDPFKAWVSLESIQSIKDLKLFLLPLLAVVAIDQLVLELDAFELLDPSPVSHVLRDNDLIIIKQTTRHVQSTGERPPKRRRLAPSPSPTTSSSGSSSTSASSSTSSSGDSEGDSSDSSSSKSEAPETVSSRKPPPRPPTVPLPQKASVLYNGPTVPPGMGSASTQDRNARRRKKRMMEKITSSGTPSLPQHPYESSMRRIESAHTAGANVQHAIPPSIAANLHNKNKRKGFKQSMDGQQAQRIVFEHTSLTAPIPPKSIQFHRVTPPSEQPNLPFNVIITSVDVEEGLWPSQRESRKRLREEEEFVDNYEEKDVSLDYGEDKAKGDVPIEEIEAKFDSLPKVQSNGNYPADTLFAFKELDIDPATLSPQMVLKLARLQKQDGIQCEVVLLRSSVGVAAFGGGIVDGEDEEAAEETKLSIHTGEMEMNDWRIVI